jgi:hypothetical protein
MARRWVWSLLIAAGMSAAGVASLPAVIEWQGTRLVRESLLPSAIVDVVHFGLSGATVEIKEREQDSRGIGLIDLRYGVVEGISARLDLDLPVAGLMPDGVAAPEANLKATGSVEPLEGWRWRFTPDDCVTLTAERIVLDQATLTRPESLCLKSVPDHDFLVFDAAEGWLAAFQVRRVPVNLETPDLKVTGNLAEAAIQAAIGLDGALKADYAIATIRDDRKPAFFEPLKLTGSATGSLGGEIDFDAVLATRSGMASIMLQGRHNMPTGAGQVGIRMKPTLFGPDAAEFTTLFPIMHQWIGQLTGTLGVKAEIAWGKGADPGKAEILLRDVAVNAGAVTASGINAVLTADRLSPLRLPSGQTISIGLMDAGVPLTDGEIQFGVRGDKLSVAKAEWNWAGGTLRAAPFETGMSAGDQTIVLEAEHVDLRQLLSLAAIDGLSASGNLSGSLPVHISPDAISVEEGRLETAGSGSLRYDPDDPPAFLAGDPGSGTDMLLKALTDFRYDRLVLSVDGQAGGEMTLSFAIRGSNPSFYGGYPVALNLKVGGALDTILRRGLATYRIPSAVHERMMEFQDQNK